MTRVMVVADCGTPMATLTTALARIRHVDIVRHASARGPLGPMVRKLEPDLVFIDEVHWPALILHRVAELREHAPGAAIVVLTSHPDAPWLADALRAGATAVASTKLDQPTLARLVGEVLSEPSRSPTPVAA
jgi:DNA-binding NarL/FixJ family response regulator